MITNWLHEEQSTSNAVIAVSKIITRLISASFSLLLHDLFEDNSFFG
jgi:hypothetical protein